MQKPSDGPNSGWLAETTEMGGGGDIYCHGTPLGHAQEQQRTSKQKFKGLIDLLAPQSRQGKEWRKRIAERWAGRRL